MKGLGLLQLVNKLVILLNFLQLDCLAEISNLRKCANEQCSERISQGRTTQRYDSLERGVLSFAVDEKVDIYSKEAGTNSKLWGVEINGRKGFISKKFIVEEKVFKKDGQLKDIISTDKERHKIKEPLLPENEAKPTTGSLDNNEKKMLENVLMDGKVIEHVPELTLDSPNLDKSKNINSNLQEVDANNGNGENKEPLNTDPNRLMELDGEAVAQSAKTIIEKVISNDKQKQGEFPLKNVIMDSSEPGQKSSEMISEEIPLKGPLQNNEEMKLEGEITVTSEAPTTYAKEANDKMIGKFNSISNQMLEKLGDESVVVIKNDAVFTDEASDVMEDVVDSDHGPDEDNNDDDDDDDEEQDNEDEGNGNEGEENGKEMDIRLNPDSDKEPANNLLDKEIKDDLTHNKEDMVTNIVEELSTVPSNIIPISKTINNSDVDILPEPTPSRNFEVFEGTTLFVDDVHENSGNNEGTPFPVDVTSPSISLQTSQGTGKSQELQATPIYETTPMPIVTAEGFTILNKEKVSLPDMFANSNGITEEERAPLLPLDVNDAITDSIPVLSQNGNDVTGDILDENIPMKNTDSHVGMETNSAITTQALNLTEFEFIDSEVEKPVSLFEAESINSKGRIPILSHEDEFVAVKSESILTEFDAVTEKPLEELENKRFISSFFNIGSSQDSSLESDPLEEQLTESAAGVDGKQAEDGNKIDPIDLSFSDPYKEIPDEFIDVPEMLSEKLQQQINSEDKTKDLIIEAASTPETGSFSDVIFGIPQKLLGEGFAMAFEEKISQPQLSARSVTLLVILSFVIVTLHIAHSIIIKTSREAPLLDAMNKLDKEQRLIVDENNNLKRMLSSSSNGQVKSYGSNVYDHIEFVRLKDELSTTKSKLELQLVQLKQHNQQLEKDLENSTANEEELNRMMSELLSTQNDTQNFEESVNYLQATLDAQKEKVESLTADLAHKSRLNDELRAELRSVKERSSKLEYQIDQLSQSLMDMNSSKLVALKRLSEEENNVVTLRDVNISVMHEAETIRKQSSGDKAHILTLKETIKDLQKKLDSKIVECKISKECFKKLQGNNTKGKLAEIFNVVEVKAKLEIAEKKQLESESKLMKELEEHESVSKFMVELQIHRDELQEKLTEAETERDETNSKLKILTQVFDEKVAQLKSQLESQEELRQDAEGSAADITNRVQSYKLELQSYKDQVLSLKQELENQQQSYKLQLANEEKKLNDTWLNARNAERRQEELRQENSQLRQKITQMHKESDQNMFKNSIKRGETNGSLSSPIPGENEFNGIHSPPASLPMDFDGQLPPMPPMFMPHHHLHPGHPPPHMGPPPLPGFLPPYMGPPPHLPPSSHLPPPHPDRRLPPAGRIASPPGYDRRSYSPASDYSDHRYSPSPRYSPGGGNRNRSPDRRSDRSRHSNVNSRRKDHSSPDRWYARSPQRFKQRQSPNTYFNHDGDFDESKLSLIHTGKKTSTPLGPNDR